MPFYIPSKTDLVKRARNAFRAEMPGTDAFLWPSNIYVSAKVLGGVVWEVMGRVAWIDKQRFASTATGVQLERHGKEYGIGRRPATYAQGNAVVPAVYPYTVPKGTVFVRSDGLQYVSSADVSLLQFSNSTLLSVPVVCTTVGKKGNLAAGAPLTTALPDVTGVVVDDDGFGQGADVELDGAPYTTSLGTLRGRILARKRLPPQGGSANDYKAWAATLPGVTRVFVAPLAFGPGTVAVWFMMDDTYPQGLPQLSDVAAVQAYINSVAPVTANVIVLAPIADAVDVVVQNFVPNTEAARQSAAAELYSMFRNMTQPGLPGASFTLYRSWVWQAVSNAAGEQHHSIAYPPNDLVYGPGRIPCLNSVRFM